MARPLDPPVAQLLALLDHAYDTRSWHGPNLRGALRGVTPVQALWRPAPDRHNIWELAVHAAYWKYVAVRRLTNATRGRFPIEGSNWFERNGPPGSAAWRRDLQLLAATHATLRDVVSALGAGDLRRQAQADFTVFGLVSGVAAHDLYHAGQIQLVKALQRAAPRTKGR